MRPEVRPETDEPVDVTVVGRRLRIAGIRTHQTASFAAGDIRTLHGIPLTSPARTLLDCAADLPTHELATSLELALVNRLVTKREIEQTLDRSPRRAGSPDLRALLKDQPFTRSKAERLLAQLLRAAKLPRPAFNTFVESLEVDAVWRPERVILEFDSYEFHATRAAFERDRRRDATLIRAGYVVLRTTWHELTEHPYALIARIAEALALARATLR
jgi:very-short-patch-repair endonuclease